MLSLLVLIASLISCEAKSSKDIPCQWDSHTGSVFDLRRLIKAASSPSYQLNDGDIPCTPETEPTFTYTFNFCADVTPQSVPQACIKKGKVFLIHCKNVAVYTQHCNLLGKSGVALQSMWFTDSPGGYDCYVIGTYNPEQDDLVYSLLDPKDPSKGVTMTYPQGDLCQAVGTGGVTQKVYRSATLDVVCANVPNAVVVSANEPHTCGYHLTVKSYYGCPTVSFVVNF